MEFNKELNENHFSKLQEICREKNGTLLSGKFRSAENKIQIKCEDEHIFTPSLQNVIRLGTWCNHIECLGRRISETKVSKVKKRQERRIRNICEEKGGTWVSGEYKNNHTDIKIRCSNSHEFPISPDELFQGNWCGRCVGKYPPDEAIIRLQEICREKGGEVVSEEYINGTTDMIFRCEKNHTWPTTPGSIIQGTWCPYCTGNMPLDEKQLLQEMQKIAADHTGYATKVFKPGPNQDWRVEFICDRNHRWDASIYSARKNHWCSTCNTFNTSETICRSIFEWVFQRDFQKVRPDWLLNDRGNRMELDGYNEELNIAFEYQGEQHSTYIPFFHGDDENAFQQRIDDDLKKIEICEQREILLFHMPISVPLSDLQTYLLDEIRTRKLDEKFEINSQKLDVTEIETGNIRKLLDLQKICRSKGGKCLSSQYITSSVHLEFECQFGHRWPASPSSIINNGTWCNECAKTDLSKKFFEKLDMDFINETIQSHNGELLDTFSEKNKIKLKVECNKGHVWNTDLKRLRDGRWCQKCSAKEKGKTLKLTIEDLHKTAEDKGGKCLSQYYFIAGTKYLWKCKKKHKWLATANSVRSRNSWCPVCAGKPQFEFLGSVEEFLADEKRRFLEEN
jgi:hypothetical protein